MEGDVAPDSSYRVLVVDDDKNDADLNRQLLVTAEYDVRCLYDSIDAMEHVIDDEEHYDLLVLDVNMPEIDGVTLARRIKAAGLVIPILLVSGNSKEHLSYSIQTLGPAIDFLQKPFSKDDLLRKASDLISRSHTFVRLGEMGSDIKKILANQLTTDVVREVVNGVLDVHCVNHREKCFLARDESRSSVISQATDPAVLAKKFADNKLVAMLIALATFIASTFGALVLYNHQLASTAQDGVIEVRTGLQSISTALKSQNGKMTRILRKLGEGASLASNGPSPGSSGTLNIRFDSTTGSYTTGDDE